VLPNIISASERFQLEGFVNFWGLVCSGTCSDSLTSASQFFP